MRRAACSGERNTHDIPTSRVLRRGPDAVGIALKIDILGTVDPVDRGIRLARPPFIEPALIAVLTGGRHIKRAIGAQRTLGARLTDHGCLGRSEERRVGKECRSGWWP